MKIISANCPNCGKTVDMGIDKLQSFCGYCGSKLMIDIENVSSLLIEQERTKQKEADIRLAKEATKQQSEQAKIEIDKRKRLYRYFITIFSIYFIVMLALLIFLYLMEN